MRNFINRLAFFSIFLDNLYLPFDLGFDFRVNYLFYAAFIVYYLCTYQKIRLSVKTGFVFVFVTCLLFLIPLIKGSLISSYFKQAILITFNLVFCILLLNAYKFDLERIVKDYLSIAKLIGVVVIFQFVSIQVGFLYGADYSYLGFDMGNFDFNVKNRMQAWFQEPSFLIYAIIPAVFVACTRFFKISKALSRSAAILILFALILAWSSVGFIGLLLILSTILFSKYPILKRPVYLVLLISLVPVIAIISYQDHEVKQRVDDSFSLFFGVPPTSSEINNTNLSTYALYSNYMVTKETFIHDPIFGTGLGTYEDDYDKYITKVIPESQVRDRYQLNKKDANSLLFRVLAETGILCLFFLGLFIYNKRMPYVFVQHGYGTLWAINNGIFILILLRLLRQGHYTSLGFIFFLLLFYFTKRTVVKGD